MKILHIIPSVGEARGGPSRAVLDMTKALQAQATSVTLATTNDNGAGLLDVKLGQLLLFEGVPTYFFQRFSPSVGAVREFAFSSQLTHWLWQNIHSYDLVHVHAIFSYAATMAMVVARMRRIPYIATPHGMLGRWPLQQGRRKKQIYLNLIERNNLNHAQALHFTAELEAQEAMHLGLQPPHFVLPFGLDIPQEIPKARERLRETLGIAEDAVVILFLARLHPVKGLDYLIPSLGQIKDLPFTFVIAGSGSPAYEQEVQKLVTRANLQTKVYWAGFVHGERKALLLQGADLLTLTSHSENFGVVVLEALAAGTPVLATPGVPLASTLSANQIGYVVDLDIRSIAQALREILNQRASLLSMGKRARQFVATRYTWDSIAVDLVKYYRAVKNREYSTQHKV